MNPNEWSVERFRFSVERNASISQKTGQWGRRMEGIRGEGNSSDTILATARDGIRRCMFRRMWL